MVDTDELTSHEHVVENDDPISDQNEIENKIQNPDIFKLDLSTILPIYVLTAHLSLVELHEVEELLTGAGAPLTYDISEARLVIGKITKPKRASHELRCRGIWTEPASAQPVDWQGDASSVQDYGNPVMKKRRLGEAGSSDPQPVVHIESNTGTETETEDEDSFAAEPMSQLSISQASSISTVLSSDQIQPPRSSPPPFDSEALKAFVTVVNLDWLHDSVTARRILRLDPYVVYKGKPISPPAPGPKSLKASTISSTDFTTPDAGRKEPVRNIERSSSNMQRQLRTAYARTSRSSILPNLKPSVSKRPKLIHQTTSEHDESVSGALPRDPPKWAAEGKVYACERSTPPNSPNDEFIELLKRIRLARILTLDEIGVRAYSTSIASLAAYPYAFSNTREILALPGCDQKIAHLFYEWHTDGRIQAVEDIEADPELQVLRNFYEIWGVGAKTAREFYDKGWRDLDDIVASGWPSLSRVQQIGVKYYDEFRLKIPRSEVEAIASIVIMHARLVRDNGIECAIVGGYRRGKAESGDVDIILSHRDEKAIAGLVEDVVLSLETEGWITHTLILNSTNTKRGQQPLPARSTDTKGAGFDTLDKALVVWQDLNWPSRIADLAADPKAKNPNVHRRVDIIISPWKTVGCAVTGWSGGTTFQRDLRRYAKHQWGWKFDSSGIRERGTGKWVDLEKGSLGWEDAEKKVFDGLGLVWREPWERCTG